MSFSKRLMDIILSSIMMLLLLPISVIISIMILFDDGRPIFFKQKRLGINGKEFFIYKFRKFTKNVSKNSPLLPLQDDPRYTWIGLILEKTKLNEIPQLWNVLAGEMSLVGPRPELVEFKYCFQGPYSELLKITPGIFGPSQSKFRNEADLYPPDRDPEEFYNNVLFPSKAIIDIDYYKSSSIASDFYWIIQSLRAVFIKIFFPSKIVSPDQFLQLVDHRCDEQIERRDYSSQIIGE